MTNSLYFLTRVSSTGLKPYIIQKTQIQKLLILIKHDTISEVKTIIYCWVPSHIGFYGNEKVN